MALLVRARLDTRLVELFDESGETVQRACGLLRTLIEDPPERAALARELVECEHEGDRITHDIIHRLNGEGRGKPPHEVQDLHQLATALDDIVDFAEQTSDTLLLYGIEAPMDQA